MSLSWTPFLNEFFSCLSCTCFFPAVGKCSFHPLWVRSFVIHHAVLDLKLLCLIVDNPLSLTDLLASCHFLRHHPIWPCLPKLLASVGAVFAPRRRCASRSSTCCATSPRAQHTLCLQSSSALGRHSFPSNYNTACLTRGDCFVFLLFQLHFVVVYSAVYADSTSGTSDTTAWSSVHGRCSRSTVEVLYNNAVCCLSPLSFWSLGLYHSVVPEAFNTTSVVVVRGKTSCVPSPSSSLALLRQSLCFSRARGRLHVSEFCDRFVGAFRESLPAGPRCRAPLPRGFC